MSKLPSRRAALGLGLGGCALAGSGITAQLLGRAAGAKAQASRVSGPLRIGYLPITDATALVLAQAKGFYREQGVQVGQAVMFRSWASLTEAFVSGTVDVIHLLMPMAIYLKYKLQVPAQIVAWNHVNGSALTLAPHLKETSELAGKTLAIPAWFSVHNILLQKLLRSAGLTPVIRRQPRAEQGETGLIVMSPSDMIPALANATIAGFAVADPFNAAAYLQQVGRIHRFMGDIWRQHACCVTVIHSSLYESSPQTAQKLVNALVQAQNYGRQNRVESAKILASNYLPQKESLILRALTDHGQDHPQALHHPSWRGQLLDFQPYPYPSYTQELVSSMQETLVDAPTGFLSQLDPGGVHADLVNQDLVKTALKNQGGLSIFGQNSYLRREEIAAS
ncbi:MAG: ABC transporter substrate-binding protein [Rothia sp. (in: high G+C Gram-positive bacteria)]|nr:ABC transporter substrate-binding protein [Rothia sp. (in: high G+C Gram-positive bacteria)]